jgi:hypothetical protein
MGKAPEVTTQPKSGPKTQPTNQKAPTRSRQSPRNGTVEWYSVRGRKYSGWC